MTAILLETVEQRLSRLIDSFQAQLLQWSSDGTLAAAAQHVLQLTTPEELGALEVLLGSWALGDTANLPQVELLSGEQLTGAAGAYASSTQTVYFNAEWFEQASDDAILFVLTEEFGHWLEDQVKGVDTPGDEGAQLAIQLLGNIYGEMKLAGSYINENDMASITINLQNVEVEMAALETSSTVRRVSVIQGDFYGSEVIDGVLYFRGYDEISGSELWKTDGTVDGTVLVAEIMVGSYGSRPISLSELNGTLYFSANDGIHGYQIWSHEDNGSKTIRLTSIGVGSTPLGYGSIGTGYIFTTSNGILFGASDGVSGYELWKSDGTAAGTYLLKDIKSGEFGSYSFAYTQSSSQIFFAANDGTSGYDLWKSDGTPEGTVLVKDINPGIGDSNSGGFVDYNGFTYFRANDGINGYELWRTDGTTQGTTLVLDINTASVTKYGTGSSDPYSFVEFRGELFFFASDGLAGSELWKTDGTSAGTVLVADINPGKGWSRPFGFVVVNESLYFTAGSGLYGREGRSIWKTDGTTPGTVKVMEFATSTGSDLKILGSSLLFNLLSDDGLSSEIWSLDVSSEFASCFSISANDVQKKESNADVTPFSFTVTRTGDLSACSLTWTAKGTGLNPATAADFANGVLPSGILNFAAGEASAQITVNVVGDTAEEGNETFKIVLSDPPTGSALSKSTATSIIQNDDGTYLSIAALQASLNEGNTGSTQFTFSVTRSGDTTDTSEVHWIVSSGSPNGASVTDFFGAGANFPKGSLMFMAGETSKSIAIDVAGDASFEANETFVVSLVNQIDASIIEGSGSAAGTILNDDAPPAPPVISISGSTSKQEGDSDVVTTYTFTVSRSGDTSNGCFVDWAVSGSGASPANAADFVGGLLPAGTLNFAANQTSQTISIQVKGDLEFESHESFVVTLSNPTSGVSLGTSTATGTINNDDSPPVLSITSFSADKLEGNGPGSTAFTFRVSRTGGDISNSSSVLWTVSGAAVNEADFAGGVFPTGTANFAAGSSFQDITINVSGDINLEGDELFTVSLSGADGATIGVESASGIIRNDDTLPKLSIATTGTSDQGEGYSGFTPFTFTVVRSGDTTNTSSVSWAVTGLGINPASASDFQGGTFPSGTVQFAPGATTATITVNVVADQAFEANESFLVTLSNPQRSTITNATATGIIRNDDLIGTSNADTIIGNTFSDFIDGRKGQDSLTGSLGSDIFGFRFGQSLIKSPDRITDFEFGQDKIDLFTSTGAALPAPTTFFRAADNASATSLTQLASAVFADADGFSAGNQALAANGAVLVNATNASIVGTYLFINNGTASFGSSADLVVNVTGYAGSLPSLGSINPSQVFI